MESKPCARCATNPRKPGRSYCSPCDRAKQRIRYQRTKGLSVEEIVHNEVQFRLKEAEEAEIEAQIAASLSEEAEQRSKPHQRSNNDDDLWTDEEIAAFNEGWKG